MTNEKRREHPYYKTDTKFQQWSKKDDLKKLIKSKQEELVDWVGKIDISLKEGETKEQHEARKKENQTELNKRRTEIKALEDQLKEVAANKLGSKAFETSTTPPNRQQRRQAIKNRRRK